MNRIRILPDQVANQIAAGEVVERPASALKELVENAIDAGAKSIQIEIRGGGKSLIRVQDDGFGMGRDDVLLCLERHATSKIHDSADMGAIQTLGFRGEAIPSIASVSRFRILTREPDSEIGTEIEISGGKILSVKDAGCAPGTLVEVRNLFFNLPARRKFLRSDATELGHLQHTFFLHAIAQPRLGWSLQQDGRMLHQLHPHPEIGDDSQGALMSRIKALHGNQLASQLVPVQLERGGLKIQGWIGKPGLSRSNRSELYCFVNSRPVDSRAIYYGMIEGYHSALMRGRYPVCFLFLEIDPTLVDVNIHPAKREVRFREDAMVQGCIVEAVRKALGSSGGVAPLQMGIGKTLSHPAGSSATITARPSPMIQPSEFQNFPQPAHAVAFQPPLSSPFPGGHIPISAPQPDAEVSRETSRGEVQETQGPTILGVFANLYVVAVDDSGLIIVDQHAAHERILFEQMMDRLSKGQATSQGLLLPQTVELSPNDALKLRTQLPLLEKMGFGISEFGDKTFMVDALPPMLKSGDVTQLLRQIIDEIGEAGKGLNRDRFAEEVVAKTVCRHAVKANDRLRVDELRRMIQDLKACQNPLTCPHGRPTMLNLTQAELERKFGRRPIEG